MVIKYVSVCEFKAPAYSDKPDYFYRAVCIGKHKSGTEFMFKPFLLGEKKVIKVQKLPYPMTTKKEVREWYKTDAARPLFDKVKEIEPIGI